MNFLFSLYHTVLFEPLFNTLVILYNLVPGKDFGVAVILVTLLVRFAFAPLSAKAVVAQRKLAALQPKAKEIQERLKTDRDKQAKELLGLYKKEGVNPFAGILPILIQLPFLIALYQVFWKGLGQEQLQFLYGFVNNPGFIDPTFLGMVDLGERSFVLAILAAIFQFFQGKQMAQKHPPGDQKSFAATFQKQALYFFPVLTLLIVSQLPSAIGLYWITTSLFSIGQQWYIVRTNNKRQTTNDT
ncbi:MAG: YidC/Oxa1 family membrane protein insertase [bacterium]|nr:YidC/Oxa1 family membrane protein insertase [bacterium]